jgi:glucosamine--fructose-6-phosphate aminotransferase (isomerizing)
MCGIFGVTGQENNQSALLNGIKQLEYRGYDSAGIAFFHNNTIQTIKEVGEISALQQKVQKQNPFFTCGIAHTRWATHGEVTKQNAHPHESKTKQFALVHNGIIENFKQLKEEYLPHLTLQSQTDSEVIVQLLETLFEKDVLTTLKKVCDKLVGSYALCVLYKKEPNKIYVTRRDSPLCLCQHKNTTYVASDVSALSTISRELYLLNNNEYAVLSENNLQFYDTNLNKTNYSITHIQASNSSSKIGDFLHFMQKEIYEVPEAVLQTVSAYPSMKSLFRVVPKKVVHRTKHIKLIACGAAYHAGLIAKKIIEQNCPQMQVETCIASEFRYSNPHLKKHTLCIFISQSGETADTLACVKLCNKLGATTLSVTNVKNSSITYLAKYNLYTLAGREVAVASTKAYNSQLGLLYLFASLFSKHRARCFTQTKLQIVQLFLNNNLISSLEQKIIPLAQKWNSQKNIYFIGRQLDYHSAQEASLKLKEITYIPCEAYPAGELKHGTLSLIETGSLVVCFLTQSNLKEKTLSNLFEVKSRGATVLLITNQTSVPSGAYDELIFLDSSNDRYLPIVSMIPIQLLSYHISRQKGINPDKPRNLAKAVTVE